LYFITLVRLMTFRSAILARSVRISSCTPPAKKCVLFVLAEIFKRQHGDAFLENGRKGGDGSVNRFCVLIDNPKSIGHRTAEPPRTRLRQEERRLFFAL
jgi:hypothetical protein